MEQWKRFWETIKIYTTDMFFEEIKDCAICGQREGTVCPSCREIYFCPETPRCHNCGKLMLYKRDSTDPCVKEGRVFCEDCLLGRGPRNIDGVTVLGHYQGEWKKYIHKLKFKSQPYLLASLEKEIIQWVIWKLPLPDLVIPVPMPEKRLLERGFNQAEALASLLARALLIKQEDGLLRKRETKPQSSLGRQDRLKNLQSAFRSNPDVNFAGKTIWLVDDVITTGTTLDECAKILKEAGAAKVHGFCLAAGGTTKLGLGKNKDKA